MMTTTLKKTETGGVLLVTHSFFVDRKKEKKSGVVCNSENY